MTIIRHSGISFTFVPRFVQATTTPGSSDDSYDIGSLWVNTTGLNAYICIDNTKNAAVWKLLINEVSAGLLNDLADVVITSPTNNDVLTYNSGSANWVNQAPAAAGSVTPTNEASDTTCFPLFVDSATGNQTPHTNTSLTYNSSNNTLGVDTINSQTTNADLSLNGNGSGRVLMAGDFYSSRDSSGALLIRNHLNQGTLEVATDGTRLCNMYNATVNGALNTISTVTCQATTDTTAASTGSVQLSSGLYVAKNIMTSQRVNSSPWIFLKQGSATLGSTNASLSITSLPAYNSYKIYAYTVQKSASAYNLRMLVNTDTSSNYDSTFVTTAFGLNSTRGWNIHSGTEKRAITLEILLAGKVNAAGDKFTCSYPVTFDSGVNTAWLGGGHWHEASTTQISSIQFEVFINYTTTSRYTATDVMTVVAEVYGSNFGTNTWS